MKPFYLLFVLFLFSCTSTTKQRTTENTSTSIESTSELNEDGSIRFPDDYEKIGKWYDTRPGCGTIITLAKQMDSDNYLLLHEFSDGSYSMEEAVVTKENNLTKFRLKEQIHLEWYIIESNGDLSMYSQNGKFGTALAF